MVGQLKEVRTDTISAKHTAEGDENGHCAAEPRPGCHNST